MLDGGLEGGGNERRKTGRHGIDASGSVESAAEERIDGAQADIPAGSGRDETAGEASKVGGGG